MPKNIKPEQIIADHPEYGTIFMGPSGEDDKIGEKLGTNLVLSLKGGHNQTYLLNGNKGEIIPGSSHEIVGINLSQGRNDIESEIVAKSIVAETGDIVIIAEDGNIKLKANNIYIETEGSDNDGSILMKANDHITIKADEQLSFAGGKICMVSSDSITMNAKGLLHLLVSDINKGSPLGDISKLFLPGPVADLISSILETCK
jgi:hypothetical protein